MAIYLHARAHLSACLCVRWRASTHAIRCTRMRAAARAAQGGGGAAVLVPAVDGANIFSTNLYDLVGNQCLFMVLRRRGEVGPQCSFQDLPPPPIRVCGAGGRWGTLIRVCGAGGRWGRSARSRTSTTTPSSTAGPPPPPTPPPRRGPGGGDGFLRSSTLFGEGLFAKIPFGERRAALAAVVDASIWWRALLFSPGAAGGVESARASRRNAWRACL